MEPELTEPSRAHAENSELNGIITSPEGSRLTEPSGVHKANSRIKWNHSTEPSRANAANSELNKTKAHRIFWLQAANSELNGTRTHQEAPAHRISRSPATLSPHVWGLRAVPCRWAGLSCPLRPGRLVALVPR